MFIVIEGGDGSGKDTAADLLVRKLSSTVHDPWQVLRAHEPDEDLPGGAELRRLLKSGDHRGSHPGLFLANRMALMETKIKPALQAGHTVVEVRSFLSSLVYQQELAPLQYLFDIHRMLPCKMTHVFILDVDPAEGLRRVGKRGADVEVYERLDIQQRNRQRYLDLAKDPRLANFMAPGGKVMVLDTNGKTPEEVHEQVMMHLTG